MWLLVKVEQEQRPICQRVGTDQAHVYEGFWGVLE